MRPANSASAPHTAPPPSGSASASSSRVYNVPPSAVSRPTSGGSVLTPAGSGTVVQQINAARSKLTGVNQKPIPSGQVTAHSNGGIAVSTADGRQYGLRANGTLASYSSHGTTVAYHPSGQIRALHTATLDCQRGAQGQRVVMSRLPDHQIVLSTGRHLGYVERHLPFRNGQNVFQRTYVTNGMVASRVYFGYRFHNLELHHFVPAFAYAPLFYGWAYYPWDVPVPYAWAWVRDPWYSYNGGYFVASPRYASASAWIADYFLAQTLANAYQAQLDAQQTGGSPLPSAAPPDQGQDEVYAPAATPITEELKQAIADEVGRQLSYESAASTQPEQAATLTDLPQALQPNRIFVVDIPVSAATSDSQYCSLSGGDVLRLVARPDDSASAAELVVASGKQGDCPAGVRVLVTLQDLQEMQNNFRAQLDAGLQQLHDQQGHNGLPAAPPSAIGPPPRRNEYGEIAPDPTAAAMLDEAQRQAGVQERQLAQSAFAPGNQVPANK